jgi:hypothetical protein
VLAERRAVSLAMGCSPESQTLDLQMQMPEAPPPEMVEREEVLHQHENAFENGTWGA